MPTRLLLCLLALLGLANISASADVTAASCAEIGASALYASLVSEPGRSGLVEAGIATEQPDCASFEPSFDAGLIDEAVVAGKVGTPVSRADLSLE